jgi:LacI family transcriptional regulator
MTTIFDIAALAGVSSKTVSRVLGDDRLVRPATRTRVLAAADRLNYRLNTATEKPMAHTLIGLLLDDPTSSYHTSFHHALITACAAGGKNLVTEFFDLHRPDWQAHLDTFISHTQIQALVLLPPLSDFGPLKSFLNSRDINCVLISPSTPDSHYASVAMDDHLAARHITQHLIDLGHRRIAHIGGHPDHAASLLRRNGFYEAFDVNGLARPSHSYMETGDFTFLTGCEAAERLLNLPLPPTAVFAGNDDMAAGACAVAHTLSVKIPEQLSIVGFDDAPISAALWPPLTTVRQPYADIARRSLELLDSPGSTPKDSNTQVRYILAHEIIARKTTTGITDLQADGPIG